MRIMKFGGTSLKDAAAMTRVRDLIITARRRGPVAVVVSAVGGVTDQLLEAAELALGSFQRTLGILAEIEGRHLQLLEVLLPEAWREGINSEIRDLLANLKDILHGVCL